MPIVIIYTTEQINYEKLQTLTLSNYNQICYGKLVNKWWFSYGNYTGNIPSTTGILEGAAAYEYIAKKAITSVELLGMCNNFSAHTNTHENCSDIEVENIGSGSFINFVSKNLLNITGNTFNDGKGSEIILIQ